MSSVWLLLALALPLQAAGESVPGLFQARPANVTDGANEQSAPRLFEAQYGLHRSGLRIADMRFSLQAGAEDHHYLLRQEASTSGLAALFYKVHMLEESHWRMHGAQLQPLEYRYLRTGGSRERRTHIRFDWQGQQVINRLDDSRWPMPAKGQLMDKLLYQLAIMYDLERGQLPSAYLVADRDGNRTYHIRNHGQEEIDTALGRYTTLRLERVKPGDDRRRTLLWCAPGLGHLPVRIRHTEKDGSVVTALLEAWSEGSAPQDL